MFYRKEGINGACTNDINKADYSGTDTIAMYRGTQFQVSVPGNTYGNSFKGWIDWNRDGIFDNQNELAVASNGNISGTHFNGTITIPPSASYGSALWSNGSTADSLIVNSSGSYFVTITSPDGCHSSDSITVTMNSLPAADSISVISNGDCTITLSAAQAHFVNNFDWAFGDNSPHSTLSNPAHAYSDSGSYKVVLIISNECGTDTIFKWINCVPNGIHPVELSNNQLQLYPNPARDQIVVKNKSRFQMQSIVIYNVLGQEIYHGDTKNPQTVFLNARNFASGIYHMKIYFENGNWTQRKFVISR